MADVNTDPKEEKFVFGQNMEDRAIRPQHETKEETSKSENGAEEEKRTSTQSPLRPSAFRPGGGILAPSRLGANPFVSRPTALNHVQDVSLNSNPFAAKANPLCVSSASADEEGTSRMILKPSALDRQTANLGKHTGATLGGFTSYKSTFKLEPAKLRNPFSTPKSDHKENMTDSGRPVSGSETNSNQVPDGCASGASVTTAASPESKGAEGDGSEVEKSKPKNFIFGQNMENRVTETCGPTKNFVFGEMVGERVSGVGDTSLTPDNDKQKSVPAESTTQTLVESAAAHQAKQTKPELQEVLVKTGEENESNVFQVNAKLFSFDKATQNWLERGRGLLRLNDMTDKNESSFQSRLVMRTTGCLRVILNTKVWSGMTVEKASPRSVRVTAAESDGDIKIFLIMTNPKDADQILSAIEWRIQQLKKTDSELPDTPSESRDSEKSTQESLPSPAEVNKRHSDTPGEDGAPAKKARIETEENEGLPTEDLSDEKEEETEGKGQ